MDINATATAIINALRTEAEQQISDATGVIYGDPAHSAVGRHVGATLNSLADRIERELAPTVQLSTEQAAGWSVKVSRELLENVVPGPDPEPYVGFSGARYRVGETSVAALHDGPVGFDPRGSFGPTEDER